MRLCIRSQDTGAKTPQELKDFIQKNDLDGVQLVAYKSFPDLFDYKNGGVKNEACAKIKETNLNIPLIGAYFNPVHSDKDKVNLGISNFKSYLTSASDLGGVYVGSETGSFNDDKWTYNPLNRTDEALETVIKTFRDLCDFSKTVSGSVALEGAAGHVCYDVKTLLRAKNAIADENLKIIFDLYNFLDETNAAKYMDILEEGLDAFKKDILLFHIKDCVFEGGVPKQVPVGEGQLDMYGILKRVKDFDKNAVLVLEGTCGEYIPYAVRLIRNCL